MFHLRMDKLWVTFSRNVSTIYMSDSVRRVSKKPISQEKRVFQPLLSARAHLQKVVLLSKVTAKLVPALFGSITSRIVCVYRGKKQKQLPGWTENSKEEERKNRKPSRKKKEI